MTFTVTSPFIQFFRPETGKPLGLGLLRIGLPETDPENNPVTVYMVQPDGSEVVMSQPINLSAGGVATFNGSPVQIKIAAESVSLKVELPSGVPSYYTARWSVPAFGYVSKAELASPTSTVVIAGVTASDLVNGIGVTYETVDEMTQATSASGVIVRCKRYYADSPPFVLTYISRGTSWPVTADGYVNHEDAGGNFLELLYSTLDAKMAGAYGNDTGDDAIYVQRALNFLETRNGGELIFSQGTYLMGEVTVPNKNITIRGFGATLKSIGTGTQYCFKKVTRGGLLEVRDFLFTGFKRGIFIDIPTSEEMFYDFLIVNCRFVAIAADGWGIYLDGPREGNIDKCYFESFGNGVNSGGGIYRTLVVNTNIRDSIFKELRFGVYDDGQGSPYSAGNHLVGCVMLGVNFGVTVVRNDSYVIDGCMIDYCDVPIRFFSQDGAKVVNNYISTRTAAPAIDIKRDPSVTDFNFGIKIINNTVISHYTAGQANCIEIFNAQDCTIDENYIQFYNFYGIRYRSCFKLSITNNVFGPRPGSPYTPVCIANPDGDSNTTNKVLYNSFEGVAFDPPNQNILARHNLGFVTQAFGVATLPASANTVTVPHGMALAPGVVLLSPQADGDFYYDLDGVTGINIRTSTTTGSPRQIAWVAYTTFAIVN